MHQNDTFHGLSAHRQTKSLDEQVRLATNEMGGIYAFCRSLLNKSFYKWQYCLDANIFIAGGRDIHVEHAVLTMAVRWPEWFHVNRKVPNYKLPMQVSVIRWAKFLMPSAIQIQVSL